MRVAIVTESFLPRVNGVSNTVRHVVDRLLERGHQALVIAPGPGVGDYRGVPVVPVRSMELPGYRSFPLGLPDLAVERAMVDFSPDVVHLASPIMLGVTGLRAARRLGIPTVAVYQTDIPKFARQYGIRAEHLISRWVGRIHRRSDRTLVPSRSSYAQLDALGVDNMHFWRRGVSLDLFGPDRRSDALHREWAGADDRVVVGYVGRLAPEKQVRRLQHVAGIPGARLVVIGDGPERAWLERRLPDATFTGMLGGAELAQAFASLDVFVHTGEAETFCQTVQEAQASGVPVVAPAAGGPLDLVRHESTGLLYPSGNEEALAGHVARLVADPALRESLAAAALADVAGRSWPQVVDELVNQHYAAVLATSPEDDLAA